MTTNTNWEQRVDKKFTDQFWVSTQGRNDRRNEIIKSFIATLLSQARQEEREKMEQSIGWTIPIAAPLDEYVEVVKTGNMDKMYNYGFNKAKERFLALLTK